jgi:hypothetical protein
LEGLYVQMLNKSTIVTGFIVLAGLQSAVRAETYTYTGDVFETATTPYTLTDFVSGFFTLASPLADNLAFGTITPASYSFTDKVQTFASTSPPPDVTFEVGTDASGNINKWFVQLENGFNIVSTSSISSDFGETLVAAGSNLGEPGAWVASGGGGGSTVPEPSYPALIGIAMAAIAVVRRRLA